MSDKTTEQVVKQDEKKSEKEPLTLKKLDTRKAKLLIGGVNRC